MTATIRPLSRETQDIQSAAAIEPLPPKPAQTRKLVPTRKPAVPAPKPLRPGTTLTATVRTTTTPITVRTRAVQNGKVWFVSAPTVILTLPNGENKQYEVKET